MLPASVRQFVAGGVVRHAGGRIGHYARRSFMAMPRTPAAMLFDNFASIRLRDQHRLLTPRLRPFANPDHAYGPSVAQFERPRAGSTFLDRVLYADTKTYLVELLMKQDQMSMAASIESRVPFLDHHLVEFAAMLPDRWKLSGWTTKRVLREAMRGVLPNRILDRPKMGFPVPFGSWMRGAGLPVARAVLLDRRARERGIVAAQAVETLLGDHASGRIDAADQIWSLLNLELRFRTFVDHSMPERFGSWMSMSTTFAPAHPVAGGEAPVRRSIA
jgi:asparagine synthase (glutamine-hydrolysing)